MVKDLKAVAKVKSLRAKKLSFREIARLMNRDVKTIYRWHRYSLTIANTKSLVLKGDK